MDESMRRDWMYPGAVCCAVRRSSATPQTGGKAIEAMPRPLGIGADDIGSGPPTLIRRGDPGVAARAASAVPAVFRPVQIGDREDVNGRLAAPVPVQFARQMVPSW